MKASTKKPTKAKPATTAEAVTKPVPEEWFVEVRARAAVELQPHALENCNPAKAARILWLLAQGVPKLRIAKELNVPRATVSRLGRTHVDTLESKRKEFSREYAIAAMCYKDLLFLKAEQLEADPEQLKLVSPDKLAIAMAIATDKAIALSGMPGIIIETRKGVTMDEALKFVAEAKARVAQKKAEAIEAEVVAAGVGLN